MRRLLLSAAILLPPALTPALAHADDVALVLGTGNYETLPDLPRGAEMADAVDGLLALGFDVTALADARAEPLARALGDFAAAAPDADRILVALSGRFVTDGTRTWYLSRDAAPPSLLRLGERAVSVDSLLRVMARAPSRAVLVLGVDPAGNADFDPWLTEGVGDLAIPEGVTVITGSPRNAANFLADELSVPGGDLQRLVRANDAVSARGYLPSGFAFAPAAPAAPAATPTTPADDPEERALWQGAVALNTVDAFRNYLANYPQGRYAAQARQGIDAIMLDPNRQARLTEEALALSADQRRAVQRSLSILDFNPRGIDGIFGPATRAAITNWQQQNGFAQTGFLDAEQVARLEAQGARRAAQIEAEAQRQAEAARAADRAYWEETGARGDEAGLRAYVERYPDGLFAQAASDRLAAIEADARREAAASDRAAWDAAAAANTIRAYGAYLDAFPQGRFAADARARRAQLAEESGIADALRQAAETERALGLTPVTARAIEGRLDALGLDPGTVDGTLDGDARRALRNYQRDRNLPVTGFVDEATLVRLLADSLGGGQ